MRKTTVSPSRFTDFSAALAGLFLTLSLLSGNGGLDAADRTKTRPDLEASEGGSVSAEAGRMTLTTGKIKNIGSRRAEPEYKIKVYASTDASISETWDTLLTVFPVRSPLAPGDTAAFKIEDIPMDRLDGGRRYYIGWIVSDVRDETATENNTAHCTFPVEIPALPDLAADSERTTVLMENGRFTLSTGPIQNIGAGTANSGYMIRVYASSDNSISETRDTLLKEYKVYTSILPGQSSVIEIEDIPTEKLLTGKNYYIGWIISEVRGEIATGNNTACIKLPVKTADAPDLAATDGGSISMGSGRFTLTTGPVKNIGSVRADSGYMIDVYASADTAISPRNDILLKSFKAYSSVYPGQSINVSISDIPTDRLADGKSYYIGWVITDVRGEKVTDNNAARCNSRLKTAAFPDLEASRGGSISKESRKITLTTGTIRNIGAERAESGYTIKVYASNDTTISPSQDTLLKEFKVYSSLGAGSTANVRIGDIPTDKLADGKDYYLGWIITDVRGEKETKNNTAYCDQRYRK